MIKTDLSSIVAYADTLLRKSEIEDSSWNGLQVENDGMIQRIYCGVDATFDFFKAAPYPQHALFVVHHGLFWKHNNPCITNVLKKKIEFLLDSKSALYASHLPLDIHPEVGNNSRILQILSPDIEIEPFGYKDGRAFGFMGYLKKAESFQTIFTTCKKLFSEESIPFGFGKKKIRKCAIISGSGGFAIPEALEKSVDLFITGEYSHSAYTFARDNAMNVLFLSHYGSEKEGVIALGRNIAKKFAFDFTFLDILPIFSF